jgi:hypothetical protein
MRVASRVVVGLDNARSPRRCSPVSCRCVSDDVTRSGGRHCARRPLEAAGALALGLVAAPLKVLQGDAREGSSARGASPPAAGAAAAATPPTARRPSGILSGSGSGGEGSQGAARAPHLAPPQPPRSSGSAAGGRPPLAPSPPPAQTSTAVAWLPAAVSSRQGSRPPSARDGAYVAPLPLHPAPPSRATSGSGTELVAEPPGTDAPHGVASSPVSRFGSNAGEGEVSQGPPSHELARQGLEALREGSGVARGAPGLSPAEEVTDV